VKVTWNTSSWGHKKKEKKAEAVLSTQSTKQKKGEIWQKETDMRNSAEGKNFGGKGPERGSLGRKSRNMSRKKIAIFKNKGKKRFKKKQKRD